MRVQHRSTLVTCCYKALTILMQAFEDRSKATLGVQASPALTPSFLVTVGGMTGLPLAEALCDIPARCSICALRHRVPNWCGHHS